MSQTTIKVWNTPNKISQLANGDEGHTLDVVRDNFYHGLDTVENDKVRNSYTSHK